MKLKYLNTVLQYYRALTLLPLPTRYGADRPLCDMIAVPLLMHNICLTKDRAQIQGGNVPHTFTVPYTTANHPCPGNHFEDIRDANLYRQPVSLPGYISLPLFIATTLIRPLTISFGNIHVTMKNVGFKLPSLQHPSNQLAVWHQ